MMKRRDCHAEEIGLLREENQKDSPSKSRAADAAATHAISSLLPFYRKVWFGAGFIILLFAVVVSLHVTSSWHQGNRQRHPYSSHQKLVIKATTGTVPIKASINRDSTPSTFPFRYRGPKLNATSKAALAKQWGQWQQLHDPKAPRPALPCHQFEHCDVPRDKFPSNAWQADSEFLATFLTQAHELVTRAQEVILAEYGQSKFDMPNKTFAERSVNFQLDHLILNGTVHPPNSKKAAINNGGWTTPRSFQGLVRRLLHAVMTQDTFTFALGGHSAAAGHGNLFKQSYAMQFHRAMEPVFGRLGVQLITHNFGKGGRGTTQDSLGMGSLWGKEIDFCMWDAGMLEFKSSQYDLFARQALISGNRVPILWNGYVDVMEDLHNGADVDIGGHGTGLLGTPFTKSIEHARTLPFAARFLRCTGDRKDLCEERKYCTVCWVDRPDVKPLIKQNKEADGKMTQHPGFRSHQLTGRVLAFTILMALQEGLAQWKNTPNYALPDSAWHVSGHYNNIRSKLAKLKTTACFNETLLPSPRVCYTPMKGVSEYTPRGNPEQSSIRSIMTDTAYIPQPNPLLYDGPDVLIPVLEPPDGQVNYLAIIENDISVATNSERLLSSSGVSSSLPETPALSRTNGQRLLAETLLPIGRGWSPHIQDNGNGCNGTYDSACNRGLKNSCLLYGHNDGKGGLVFDSFSGWLLLRLKEFKDGLIIIKIETWLHKSLSVKYSSLESSELTEGWTEENNGADKQISGKLRKRGTTLLRRRLDGSEPFVPLVAPDLCPEFQFDFAINGRIQSWSKEEFLNKRIFVHRVVETWTLLDDPNLTNGKEVEVELGIRMRGCKRLNTMKLTHVYWA